MRYASLVRTGAIAAALLLLAVWFTGDSGGPAQATDFDVATLQGTVLWNGSPLDSRFSGAECGLKVQAVQAGTLIGSAQLTGSGAYNFPALQAGTYDLYLASSKSDSGYSSDGRYVRLASGPSVTPPLGVTTTQDIDVTSSLSLATGTATVGGSPKANAYLNVNHQGLCQRGQADGSFALLLPAGSYGAKVSDGPSNCQNGAIYFSVSQAGQATVLGSLPTQGGCGDPGTTTGTALFNGAPLTAVGGNSENCGLAVRMDGQGWLSATGTYSANTSWNSHFLQLLRIIYPSQGGPYIAYRYAWVTGGVTTNLDFDTNAAGVSYPNGTPGVVTGAITVNGSPLADGKLTISGGNFNNACTRTDASGNFKFYLPAGSYTAEVRDTTGSLIGNLSFSVTANTTTDIESGFTPTGTNVPVAFMGGTSAVGGMQLTFASVTTSGITTVSAGGTGPATPPGYLRVGQYYSLATTATFSGNVTTCIRYDEAQVVGPESALELRRHNGSSWDNITSSLDTGTDVICGVSTALGTFVVMEPVDGDGDGVDIPADNCPKVANAGQEDLDGDGQGNACDTDDDGDGFPDVVEIAAGSNPMNAASTPEVCDGADNDLDSLTDEGFPDTDGDGQKDCTDPDDDNDGLPDVSDNCSLIANAGQEDLDGDGQGNACDSDDDGDGYSDASELSAGSDPLNAASTPEVCDGADNDLDGQTDEGFPDTDGDSQPDCTDADDDGDGVPDVSDNCLLVANAGQENNDGDGQGDACDSDDDNDGHSDTAETSAGSDPLNAGSTPEVCDGVDNDLNQGIDEYFADADADGQANCVDADDDNDGVPDASDNCVLLANPGQADGDSDGIGDGCAFQTPPGNNVQVPVLGGLTTAGGAQLTYNQVQSGGQTQASTSAAGSPLAGHRPVSDYYDFATDAGFSGFVTTCVHYDQSRVAGLESLVKLMHDGGTGFTNVTYSLDTASNVVCGLTTSLSPFVVAEPVPALAQPVMTPSPSLLAQPVTASVSFTGGTAPFTCQVQYGTGAGYQPATWDGGTSCTGPSFAYELDRSYVIVFCVQDFEGYERCRSVSHQVAPTAVALGTGTLAGAVTWGGGPVDPAWIGGGNVQLAPAYGQASLQPGGTYSIANIAARDYTPTLSGSGGTLTTGPLTSVPPGGTATVNFDLTAGYGVVTGTVLIDGQPSPASVGSCGGTSGGVFTCLLPPGSYNLPVSYGGDNVGSIPFTLSAGPPVLNLGTNNFASPPPDPPVPAGSLSGTVRWNGNPVDPALMAGATISVPGGPAASVGAGGTYAMNGVPVGTHTVSVVRNGATMGSVAGVVITDGGAGVADIDLTNAGLLDGTFTANTVRFSGQLAGVGGITNGDLDLLMAAGSYSNQAVQVGSVSPGSVSFTITAGATNVFSHNFSVGTITGTVRWKSVPIDASWLPGAMVTLAPSNGSSTVTGGGVYGVAGIPAGVNYIPSVSALSMVLGTGASTAVSQGTEATADVSITPSAGLVTGYVTVNGVALNGTLGNIGPITNGLFTYLLRPGLHTEFIRIGDSITGSVSFCVYAGKTTELETIETDSDCDESKNTVEFPCGGDPNDPLKRPEGLGGSDAGVDDDRDGLTDEPLPPGSEGFDCDGDGFMGSVEKHVFSAASTVDDQYPCATTAQGDDEAFDRWPTDMNDDQRTNLTDVIRIGPSFNSIAPDPRYDPRFDLYADNKVNLSDIIQFGPVFNESCS